MRFSSKKKNYLLLSKLYQCFKHFFKNLTDTRKKYLRPSTGAYRDTFKKP